MFWGRQGWECPALLHKAHFSSAPLIWDPGPSHSWLQSIPCVGPGFGQLCILHICTHTHARTHAHTCGHEVALAHSLSHHPPNHPSEVSLEGVTHFYFLANELWPQGKARPLVVHFQCSASAGWRTATAWASEEGAGPLRAFSLYTLALASLSR